MCDLRHYEHISALAEKGNFRKAAEAVHISTPALTKSIQKAEESFNVKLFDRTPNGVIPTPYGEIVVRQARILLRDAEAISRNIRTMARLEGGQIRFGTYAAEALIGDVLGRFLSSYPKIRVELKSEGWRTLMEMLNNKEIDFFLSDYPQQQKSIKSIQVIDLPREDIVWYCRPKHPLLKIKNTTASDIAAFPLIAPFLTTQFEEWLIQLFTGTSAIRKDGSIAFSLQCNDNSVLKRAAACSDCVGGLFRSTLTKEFQNGSLSELHFRATAPTVPVGIVYLRDQMLSPAAERLIQMIKDEYIQRIKTMSGRSAFAIASRLTKPA